MPMLVLPQTGHSRWSSIMGYPNIVGSLYFTSKHARALQRKKKIIPHTHQATSAYPLKILMMHTINNNITGVAQKHIGGIIFEVYSRCFQFIRQQKYVPNCSHLFTPLLSFLLGHAKQMLH